MEEFDALVGSMTMTGPLFKPTGLSTDAHVRSRMSEKSRLLNMARTTLRIVKGEPAVYHVIS
jgi:hypothetical protein